MSTSTIETVHGPFAAKHGNPRHLQNTRDAIRTMTPFKTSGALYGERGNSGLSWSHRLSVAEREEFHRVANHILFVVYSYGTPIAWAYRVLEDGTLPEKGQAADHARWHYVDQKFSVTTAAHQGQVRAALNGRRADSASGIWQDAPVEWETLTEFHQGGAL